MPSVFNQPFVLRLFRAGLLLALALLVHQQARWFESRGNQVISLRTAGKYFPSTARIELRDAERGLYYAINGRGDTIGCLLRTSPQTDAVVGYSGPTDLLIALDNRGVIAGVEIIRSGDTPEHVSKIRRNPDFLRSFVGWKPGESAPPKVRAVTGATLTSFAIAEIIQQRLAGASPSLRFPEPVTLTEVQTVFSNAAKIFPDKTRLRVLDASGRILGFAVHTSPQADNIPGYRGPTDCLVALAPDGRTITDVRLRKTYDTESYVDQVRRSQSFRKQFVGRTIEQMAALDYSRDTIEGVSGATLTSRAVIEGMKKHFVAEIRAAAPAPRWRPKPRDWGLAGVIAGALVMSFTSLRGNRWARLGWQLALVGYVGLVNHDLLSLALLGGWASSGIAVKAVPALALLAAAAFLVPWTTRRQLYCHQICPHGAAQQLLGKVFRRRWTPPAKVTRVLEMVPGILLAVGIFALILGWPLNLGSLEAFDAWVWGAAGIASVTIAIIGLAASLFIPQAYCHYGCPTGALLNFVRSTGSADHWGRRDSVAVGMLVAGLMTAGAVRLWPHTETEPEPLALNGKTMGTTWSLKMRDEVADPPSLEKTVSVEFEWAESLLSNWRTNTDLSQFNHTQTTNAMAVPWPVITLSKWGREISQLTGGAYDVTVGALVNLWGFGPGPRRSAPPSDDEIAALLPSVGWEKLEILDGMLRKTDPMLELDFGSIGKGWAVDQVTGVLTRNHYTNFLVGCSGDLRAVGQWTVAIEHPTRSCTLLDEAISTSGTYRQNFKWKGREYSHLIDPRTGRPISHQTVAVSVRHDDSAHADAWSTAMIVMGREAGEPLAEKLHLAVEFVTQLPDGKLRVTSTSAWKKRDEAIARLRSSSQSRPAR